MTRPGGKKKNDRRTKVALRVVGVIAAIPATIIAWALMRPLLWSIALVQWRERRRDRHASRRAVAEEEAS